MVLYFIILKQGKGKGYLRRLDREGKVYFLLFIMEGRWREGGYHRNILWRLQVLCHEASVILAEISVVIVDKIYV